MTTRRDLIKIASALGLAGVVPTDADRVAAARILDQPGPGRVMLNPGDFASEIEHGIGNGIDQFSQDWVGVICPEEHANYFQAIDRLERGIKTHGINVLVEFGDFGAESLALILAMYDAGVRHGAAYENLRRELVGEVVQCTTCWGVGLMRKTGETCGTCGGTGTVAMKA